MVAAVAVWAVPVVTGLTRRNSRKLAALQRKASISMIGNKQVTTRYLTDYVVPW